MFPEEKENINSDRVIQQILENRSIGKRHNLVVVAEGVGGTQKLAQDIQEITGIQTRATILGHLQRGGSPTLNDRMLATMCAAKAVELLAEEGQEAESKAIGIVDGHIMAYELGAALEVKRAFRRELYELINVLSK